MMPYNVLIWLGLVALGLTGVACVVGVFTLGALLLKFKPWKEKRESWKLPGSVAAAFIGAIFGIILSIFGTWALVLQL